MRKINKIILGVAAGGAALLSGTSHGYSNTANAQVPNYKDPEYLAMNLTNQVSAKPTATPTPTYGAKPTPTYGAKPTVTYAAKPTITYASKPSPKHTPTPAPKPSSKVTPTPQPKSSPKALVNIGKSVGGVFENIGNFFGSLFGRR